MARFIFLCCLVTFLCVPAYADQTEYSCKGNLALYSSAPKPYATIPVKFTFGIDHIKKRLYAFGDINFYLVPDAAGSIIDSADEISFQHKLDSEIQSVIFTKSDRVISFGTTSYDLKKRMQLFSKRGSRCMR